MASKLLSTAERAANRTVALATYRNLLRATRIAFKDDRTTLLASRRHARNSFIAGRTLDSGSQQATQGIEHAQGVAKILRENVVQGRMVKENTYKLNIHEHTERGDNETAGRLKGTTKTWKQVKESTF